MSLCERLNIARRRLDVIDAAELQAALKPLTRRCLADHAPSLAEKHQPTASNGAAKQD